MDAEAQQQLESLPYPVQVWEAVDPDDPSSMTLRFVNEAVANRRPIDLHAMIGRSTGEIFPEGGASVAYAHGLAVTQEEAVFEQRYQDRNIPDAWFRVHVRPFGGRSVLVVVEDATEAKDRERALRDSERLNASIVANLQEGIVVIDRDGIVRQVNPAVSQLCRANAAGLIGCHIRELPLAAVLDANGEPQRVRHIPASRALRGESVRDHLVQIVRYDGTRAWVEVNSSPLREEGTAEPYGAVSTYVDVTERVERDRRVRHEADHDPLTELPNRRSLDRTLEAMVRRARDEGEGLAVLMLDLDGFKGLNDLYGHQAGDDALREAARRLRGLVRDRDVVARFGGDEFVVITGDLAQSEELAHELRARVECCLHEPMEVAGTSVPLDATVGIACFPADADSAEELLAAADQRMYERRRANR